MEFPFGHNNRRREEDEDEDEPRFPAPRRQDDPYERREDTYQPDPYERRGERYPDQPDPVGRREDRYPDQPDPYERREERYPRRPDPYGRRGDNNASNPDPYQTRQETYQEGPGHQSGRTEYSPPVQHVSHEMFEPGYGRQETEDFGGYGGREEGHRYRPPAPSHHESYGGSGSGGGDLARKPTVRVFTKAAESYSLSIRDGHVILARADPNDDYQHWIKDMKYSTRVKDEEGCPGFALVNKATGEAVKHSVGASHPVQLIPYNPNSLDESVLWAESRDVGDGFRCIRMVNNIHLNFDAFHGDKDHGGVHDGTTIVLWDWAEGDNQRWKIVPYCKLQAIQCDF